MTVRKNFVFSDEVAEHLKELSLESGKSMTAVVEELIEKSFEDIEKKRKLEALNRIKGSATGLFGDLTIQKIKANMDV
jgi:predicted DNA-binding protein